MWLKITDNFFFILCLFFFPCFILFFYCCLFYSDLLFIHFSFSFNVLVGFFFFFFFCFLFYSVFFFFHFFFLFFFFVGFFFFFFFSILWKFAYAKRKIKIFHRHDIADILLKVSWKTKNQSIYQKNIPSLNTDLVNCVLFAPRSLNTSFIVFLLIM